MRLRIIGVPAAAMGLFLLCAAAAVQPKTPPAKPAAAAGHRTAKPAAKKPLTHSAHTAKGARRTGAVSTAHTWHPRQMEPTPDRYQQIQGALAAKGYLPPESANGKWDQNSVDALKHFQADEKMEQSGKINAQSLIHLGLGPRYEPAAGGNPDPPALPPQTNPER